VGFNSNALTLEIGPNDLQLPPVSKDPANRKKYCFQSPVWAKCVPHVIELRQVFRQKDPEFVRMLRKVNDFPASFLPGFWTQMGGET
jgi:hypothetical protein